MEFVDTNVLVYAASLKQVDWHKTQAAQQLLWGDTAISLQVLQEFYVAARHPRKLNLEHERAALFCRLWRRRFTVLEPTLDLFDEALRLCERFQISYYDAAILAAAKQLGCAVVYSEDLNHGQDYDGVRVINPFRGL